MAPTWLSTPWQGVYALLPKTQATRVSAHCRQNLSCLPLYQSHQFWQITKMLLSKMLFLSLLLSLVSPDVILCSSLGSKRQLTNCPLVSVCLPRLLSQSPSSYVCLSVFLKNLPPSASTNSFTYFSVFPSLSFFLCLPLSVFLNLSAYLSAGNCMSASPCLCLSLWKTKQRKKKDTFSFLILYPSSQPQL